MKDVRAAFRYERSRGIAAPDDAVARFLVDENVPASVAEFLVERGHKAAFVRDELTAGAPDPVVAMVAEEMAAIIVT